jgi:hypothetical protein
MKDTKEKPWRIPSTFFVFPGLLDGRPGWVLWRKVPLFFIRATGNPGYNGSNYGGEENAP